MRKEELKKWLNIGFHVDIQMPNEIFDDLNKNMNIESWKHKCFAYTYYYLITYIYRNSLYGLDNPEGYNQSNILQVLTARRHSVSYLIKRNGILEKMGYIETTTNYPTSFYIEDGVLDFALIDELKEVLDKDILGKSSPNFSIKKPIKALVRFDDEDFSGTFYDFSSTHKTSVDRFVDIITDTQLGYVGFYIYSYLSMMNDRFKYGYQISNSKLAEFVGCNERTVSRYTKRLEDKKHIISERKLYEYKLLEKRYSVIR